MLAGVVSSRGAGGSVNTGDRFRFAFSAPTVPVPVPAASSSDSSDVREQTHHPAAAQTRRAEEFRPMFMKTGVISQASGSAYVEMAATKLMCGVYGPRPSASGREFSDKAIVTCEFKYTTWSDAHVRRGYQPDDAEKDAAQTVLHALQGAILREAYPKSSIDINIVVLQDGGGALAAAITCAALALMDAGVQMYDMVSACVVGVRQRDRALMLDPAQEDEPQLSGTLTAAFLGATRVTQYLQTGCLSADELNQCLDTAMNGCHVLQQLMRRQLVDALQAT